MSTVDPLSVDIHNYGPGAIDPEWLSGDQSDLMDRLKEQYRLGTFTFISMTNL